MARGCIVLIQGTRAVDRYETAFLPEERDLFGRSDDESLKDEGKCRPRTIRFGDEHADFQIADRNDFHSEPAASTRRKRDLF